MRQAQDEQRIQTICLMIVAAAAITAGLHLLADVLVPFVLAVFLAVALTPLVDLQVRRLRMPHAPAVALTLVLALVVLALVGLFVAQSMGELSGNVTQYKAGVDKLLNTAAERLDLDVNAVRVKITEGVETLIVSMTTTVIDLVSQGVLVLIFLGFLLFGATVKSRRRTGAWADIYTRTQKYIVTKVGVSAVTGILVGLTLWACGVPLALVFGLLAFLLNFIPSVGSIVSTVLPLPMILLTPGISTAAAVLAIAIPWLIQFVVGNVVEPRIMGRNTGLHPITIMIALIFWGVLWGIVGMFLATPLTAMLRILLDENPLTRPVAALMAGRVEPPAPPAPPVED